MSYRIAYSFLWLIWGFRQISHKVHSDTKCYYLLVSLGKIEVFSPLLYYLYTTYQCAKVKLIY